MSRWPIGSVTLENYGIYVREQLQRAGVELPELDLVDPRVLHHVHSQLRLAVEGIEQGRIVIYEIYSDGAEMVVRGQVVDGDRFDRQRLDMCLRGLKRDVQKELES